MPAQWMQPPFPMNASAGMKWYGDSLGNFPIFLWHGEAAIYGFPVYGEVATKAAVDASGSAVSPQTRTYEADKASFHI